MLNNVFQFGSLFFKFSLFGDDKRRISRFTDTPEFEPCCSNSSAFNLMASLLEGTAHHFSKMQYARTHNVSNLPRLLSFPRIPEVLLGPTVSIPEREMIQAPTPLIVPDVSVFFLATNELIPQSNSVKRILTDALLMSALENSRSVLKYSITNFLLPDYPMYSHKVWDLLDARRIKFFPGTKYAQEITHLINTKFMERSRYIRALDPNAAHLGNFVVSQDKEILLGNLSSYMHIAFFNFFVEQVKKQVSYGVGRSIDNPIILHVPSNKWFSETLKNWVESEYAIGECDVSLGNTFFGSSTVQKCSIAADTILPGSYNPFNDSFCKSQ